MLKIVLALASISFAAFGLWMQTLPAPPEHYTHLRVGSADGEPAHPEEETLLGPPPARSQILTPFQLGAGFALCVMICAALAVSAVSFTHQHFRGNALQRSAPAGAQGLKASADQGEQPSNP